MAENSSRLRAFACPRIIELAAAEVFQGKRRKSANSLFAIRTVHFPGG
jgi:hypothetical protein